MSKCGASTLVHIVTNDREYVYNSAEGDLIYPSAKVERLGTGYASVPVPDHVEDMGGLVNRVGFDILDLQHDTSESPWPFGAVGHPSTIGFYAGECGLIGYRELIPGN